MLPVTWHIRYHHFHYDIHSVNSMNTGSYARLVHYLQLVSFSLARFLLTFPWSWIWRWLALRFLFSIDQKYKSAFFKPQTLNKKKNSGNSVPFSTLVSCVKKQQMRVLTCQRRLSMYFFMRSLESCLASMFLVSCLSHLLSRHCAQVSLALQHETSFDQDAFIFQ